MDYRIVIPAIGRPDLLDNCLRSLHAGPRVLVINNAGTNDINELAWRHEAEVRGYGRNIGVAASWNVGLQDERELTIFCSAATVIESDMGVDWWLEQHVGDISMAGFVVPAPIGFHFFGLKSWAVEMVGYFDEKLTYYCQDTDMRRRLRLEGLEYHETLSCCIDVQEIAHGTRVLGLKGNENDDYLLRKWGVSSPNEALDITKGSPVPFTT